MGLEGFGVLAKKQEDLLAKGFGLQTLGLVTLTTASGPLTMKARASQRVDNSAIAKVSMQMKQDKITFTPKRKSDGSAMYVLDYAHSADLKLKAECKKTAVPSSFEATVSTEYLQPSYRLKCAYVHPSPALKFCGTFGRDTLGIALDGKFDLTLGRLVNYNFAHYWFSPEHRLVLKHLGSDKTQLTLGDILLSYHQTVSTKTSVGACVKYNCPRKETTIEFGGSHAFSCCSELKGKVGHTGLLSAMLSKKFGGLKLAVATQVDLKKVVQSGVSDYKMGLRVDFTT
jgi:hypothetical protein